MSPERRIRMLGDELRVLADDGIAWSKDDPYHLDRFTRVRRAAEAFSIADERDVDEIERTVFSQLTHMAPVPCGDAAIVDDDERILLIQRSDDGFWAMPGGGFHMGETPVEGVAREAREEAGLVVAFDVGQRTGQPDCPRADRRDRLDRSHRLRPRCYLAGSRRGT